MLLASLYLFGASFGIKWCHQVFDTSLPGIVLKNTHPFLYSARVPLSKLALRERLFLVIIFGILVVWFVFFNLMESYFHSSNTSILSVQENKHIRTALKYA